MRRLQGHWGLVAIVCCYLIVAALYGATIPIFETPDANGHYQYVHELTEGRGLPVQGRPSGERVTGYVASHPPLYYALCAALTFWVPDDVDFEDWAWRNPHQTMGDASRTVNKNILIHTPAERFPWRGTPLTMHLARLVSTLLGVLTVVATYGVSLTLFPEQRWLALGAAALTAFNPMFVFTSARVSNDAAVAALGSLTVWGAVRLARRGLGRRGLILTGLAMGLATLSKLSGAVLAPAVAVALLLDGARTWRRRSGGTIGPRLGRVAGRWAWLGGSALLVCGWWFGRNVVLYGELTGVTAWLSHTATVRAEPIGILSVIPQLRGVERSYWAMFGWFNIAAAPWMYRLWWVLVRAGVVGMGLVVLDQWTSRRLERPVRWGLLILGVALVFTLGSLWRFIMVVLGAQGRYLLPAVAPISVLLMLGLGRLVPRGRPPSRWQAGLSAFVAVMQLGLAVACLFSFILPAYAQPEPVELETLPEEMERLDVSFDGTAIRLLGGHIEHEDTRPGDVVPISLYWQAELPPDDDYLSFLQILGRGMEPIAGVDCYPGGGTFPPTLWTPGVVYQDRYQLRIDPGADAPTVGALHAGLYTEDGSRLEARLSPEQPPLELAILDRMAVQPSKPASADVTYQMDVQLGESITFVGYDVSTAQLSPGEPVTVTLVWRADAAVADDYTAFVHLFDSEGDQVDQSDHPPLEGAYPTSLWVAGDVIRDAHRLETENGVSPGPCTLSIGLYDPATGDRLPAYGPGPGEGDRKLRLQDDLIVVGGIAIE